MACEEGSEWRERKIVVREAYLVIRRDSRDSQDERDGLDRRRFEVRSSRFSELRTSDRTYRAQRACLAHNSRMTKGER
jgi:hypothetical protein